jgi:hypothetical protein
MWLGHDVDPLPPTSADIKNRWSYSPYIPLWHKKGKLHTLPQHFPV